MKNIYKILIFTIILAIIIAPISVNAKSTDTKSIDTNDTKTVINSSKSIVRSIWKFEQDLSATSYDNGIAKKIYYLTLSSDGTYHQYIQIFPTNPSNFFRVKSYVVDGKWSEKGGKLVLEEYGKENTIDYNYLYSNFINIDNQVVAQK